MNEILAKMNELSTGDPAYDVGLLALLIVGLGWVALR